LKDCPPFASQHRPDLSSEREAEWTRLFASGTELESRKEFARALELYRQAAEIDDTYAALAFRMARCHLALGEGAAAREQYGLADQVVSLLPEPLRPSAESKRKVLSEEECAQRLAFTDWDKRLVLERMWRRAHEPPFTEQLDHGKLIERWSALLTDLDRKTDREGLARQVGIYRNALDRRSEDWLLHHRLAFLLEAAGDFPGA